MGKAKTSYSPRFRFQAVLEALKGDRKEVEIARAFGIHPTAISNWKREFLEKGPELQERGYTVGEHVIRNLINRWDLNLKRAVVKQKQSKPRQYLQTATGLNLVKAIHDPAPFEVGTRTSLRSSTLTGRKKHTSCQSSITRRS